MTRLDGQLTDELVRLEEFRGDQACPQAHGRSQLEGRASFVPCIRNDGRCAYTNRKQAGHDLGKPGQRGLSRTAPRVILTALDFPLFTGLAAIELWH